MVRLLAAVALMALAGSVAAQPIVTDRPDFSESTSIVERGAFQIETGALRSEAGSVQADQILGTLVRIGVEPRLELRVGWAGYNRIDGGGPKGIGDLSVGGKIRLDRGGDIGVAFVGTVSIPSGDDAFRAETFNPEFRLAFSRPLPSGFGVAANVGLALPGLDGGGREQVGLFSLSFSRALTPSSALIVEGYGYLAQDWNDQYVDAALVFLLRDNVQIDAFGGMGLSEDATDWFGGLGLAFRLPR